MVKKRFDQTLYDLSDTKAKEVISALLIEDGHTITSTQEKYRCDIITEKDGEIHNAEVEIKFSWKYDYQVECEQSQSALVVYKTPVHDERSCSEAC